MSESNLRKIQEEFAKRISAGVETLPEEPLFKEGSVPVSAAVEIYRNNRRNALRTALQETFPILVRLVGEDYFGQLARAYIEGTPSAAEDLEEYGSGFPDFLSRLIPERPEAGDIPYLPDLALLEWLVQTSLLSANEPPSDLKRLSLEAEAQGDKLRLRTAHSLRTFSSDFPVGSIYNLHVETADPESSVEWEGQIIAVFRDRSGVHVEVISTTTAKLLEKFSVPSSIEDVASEFDISQLPELIQREWIVMAEK